MVSRARSSIDGSEAAKLAVREPTVGFVAGAAFVLFGLVIGLAPLADNSFLTHLATGHLILADGFPHTDPYSFTAAGEPWIVQSWLASVLYAVIDKLVGLSGIQLLTGLLTATLAGLGWRLTRSARTLVPRVFLMVVFLAVGAHYWTERPHLIAWVLFALLLVMVLEDHDPRWLVPIMFVWTNVHGSFPIGLVAIATIGLGRALDDRELPGPEIRALLWAGLGCLLGGVLNPYGPGLLVFPVRLLSRAETLRVIEEWRPADLSNPFNQVFVVQVLAALALFFRARSFRLLVPAVVFTVPALLSARNVAVASLMLLPVMASEMRDVGSINCEQRLPALRVAVVAVAVTGAVLVTVRVAGTATDLGRYPVEEVGWLADHDLVASGDRVVITHDYVGNYLELVYGTDANVFIDDRAEVMPAEVIGDYVDLLGGTGNWEEILDRYGSEVVLWEADEELAGALGESTEWEVVLGVVGEERPDGEGSTGGFIVACRVDSECAAAA